MKYTKLDVLNLMEKELRFSKHALEQMYLPSRLLSKDEVKDAIIRGEIVDIEEVQERCDKIANEVSVDLAKQRLGSVSDQRFRLIIQRFLLV